MPTTNPRRHTAVFAAILLALVTGAFAWTARGNSATRPPATPTAVATVDIPTLFESLTEFTDQRARLDAGVEQRRASLQELGTRLENLNNDLQMLREGNREALREKLREKLELEAQAKARQQALQEIISIEEAQIFKEVYIKMQAAIKLVSERDGFDVVLLDTSTFELPPAEVGFARMQQTVFSNTLIYVHEGTNITERVATLMNNEYRANP